MGGLGSILSWDEEDDDEQEGVVGLLSSVLRGRDSNGAGSGTSAPPPDMVQFCMQDGVPQFDFLQYAMGENSNDNPSQQELQQPSSGDGGDDTIAKLTMQLPLPNRVSNFQNTPTLQEQTQTPQQQQKIPMKAPPAQPTGNGNQQVPQQQIQQQFVPQQQNNVVQQQQQGLQPNFATMFAQQVNLFQQQNNMMQQGQQQQQQGQQQQQQGQQQQQQAFNFTHDPTAFLQQLQVAQLQQLAVRAQQQQQQVQMPQQQQQQAQVPQQQQAQMQQQRSNASGAGGSLQQQMQSHLTQQQMQAPVAVLSSSTRIDGVPPAKRAKIIKKPKAPSMISKSDISSITAGIVSASDTDGETSKKAKAFKKTASAAKKMKQLELPDMPDMSGMTEPEKASANRDRNREHARNTRLRKKAYLEKLKTTVDDLCQERDTLVSERAGAADLLVEMHSTRTEVLMSFFSLRSNNEKRRKLWSSVLDESCFNCVMPVTPYRSFPASEVQVSKCQRTVMGIDGMMADTASLHVLMDSMVNRVVHPRGKIEFRYTLVTEDAVGVGNQVMARWAMTTTNAVQCGAQMEVVKQGMLCCKFNSTHKIIAVELMFDVMAFMLQLKQATGCDSFSVIPNTVQTCQKAFDKPMVMTLADPPYTIVQVNEQWEDMTGFKAEEVVGKASCGILQGSKMDKKALSEMMLEVRYRRPASASLLNVKKGGEAFRHSFMVFPLSTDSRITHYVALTCHTEDGVDQKASPSTQTPAVPPKEGFAAAPITLDRVAALSTQVANVPQEIVTTLPQPVPPGARGSMSPPSTAGNITSLQSYSFPSSGN